MACAGADFVVTDVWVSMGEPKEVWAERIKALAPYAVTMDVLRATGNPDVRFLHCLPAFHDLGTEVGRDDLRGARPRRPWRSPTRCSSRRTRSSSTRRRTGMHTIKAVLVATLA
ncbi:Ornithine carbamoyltransferase OS=Streptomyces tendae OX=1932 GN=argF PE=3 SV=1 [Streptomyces tendae]